MQIRPLTVTLLALVVAAALFFIFVPAWTAPPIPATEVGEPPTSMIQFWKGHMAEPVPQRPPTPLPAAAHDGRSAREAYRNVQVLADLDAGDFMRLQQAITQWVAPDQGCAFCHAGQDYASDAKPQKQVARTMLRMVRHINDDWQTHVGQTGVTCFTCHRGHPVPAETWFPTVPHRERPMIAKQEEWRESATNVRMFFPDAGWDLYFLDDQPIAVQSTTALPSGTVASQVVAKRIYEMMMQMSDGIGVNCGYCHNSRAMESWTQSTPHRWEGHTGLGLTRDLNVNYLLGVMGLIPQTRELIEKTDLPVLPKRERGPQTGNGLVLCATCHYAQVKPMDGAPMLPDYPGLTAAHKTAEIAK